MTVAEDKQELACKVLGNTSRVHGVQLVALACLGELAPLVFDVTSRHRGSQSQPMFVSDEQGRIHGARQFVERNDDIKIAYAGQHFHRPLSLTAMRAKSYEFGCKAVRHTIASPRFRARYPLDPPCCGLNAS